MISTESSPIQNPPALIGGSEPSSDLRSAIDYLTLRWSSTNQFPQILALLKSAIGPFTECQGNHEGARHAIGATHEDSVYALWTPCPQTRSTAFQLILKGSYLTTQNATDVIQLIHSIQTLTNSPATCTRIDLCLDLQNTTEVETPTQALEFVLANPDWCAHPFTSTSAAFTSGAGQVEPTVYFGSRKSLRFVRYYDKGLQQGTDHPWYRWETVYRKEHAQAVFDALIEADPSQVPHLCRCLSSSVVQVGQTFPKLSGLLFTTPVHVEVTRRPSSRLDPWISHAHTQYLKHVAVAALASGISPGELAEQLGLFDLNPDFDVDTAVSHPRVVEILDRMYHSH